MKCRPELRGKYTLVNDSSEQQILRQHSPASAGAGHIADRVQYLTQINLGLRPLLAGFGKNGAIRSHSSSVRSDGYRFVFCNVWRENISFDYFRAGFTLSSEGLQALTRPAIHR
jgi:hypothetical protein